MARIQQEKALMSIASSMPSQFRPNFWQPQFMNSQPSPIASNPINPATTANSGNLTTTT
jgi:hypothetical protein